MLGGRVDTEWMPSVFEWIRVDAEWMPSGFECIRMDSSGC